jgi:hypothetical protein
MMFYPIDVWFEEEEDQNYMRFGDTDTLSISQCLLFRWATEDELGAAYNYYHVLMLF